MHRAVLIAAMVAAWMLFPVRPNAQDEAEQDMQPLDRPADFGDPRFAFHPIQDGYLRLDTRSGEVASCRQSASGWVCVLAPDERLALDSELGRLQRENALLKKTLLDRGWPLPESVRPPSVAPTVTPRPVPNVGPAEPDRRPREADRVLVAMKAVWRRLVEMMANIRHDMQQKI